MIDIIISIVVVTFVVATLMWSLTLSPRQDWGTLHERSRSFRYVEYLIYVGTLVTAIAVTIIYPTWVTVGLFFLGFITVLTGVNAFSQSRRR